MEFEAWRENLLKQIENDEADWEEEQLFQELVMFTPSLSIATVSERLKRRRINKDRNREQGHERIWKDYFGDPPTYSADDFRRRFRMTKRLFQKLLIAIPAHDEYFQQKRDAANKKGLSSLQKITAALRQLAQGVGADSTDEYCRLGEATARISLYRFCRAIRNLYEEEYLRKPTPADLARLLAMNEKRGFPGMFASLDCMHYDWKNCPVAWQGQFTNKDGSRSIVLEAIADYELWIWHAFFGLPGGNNDLNVLDRSPLLNDMIYGRYDHITYTVKGIEFNRAYLLVDGIYPQWPCFIPSIHQPQSEKKKFFAKVQEGCRKDVERAFGVLQARWGIIRQPSRAWREDRVLDVILACIILHNMIIEDERGERYEDFHLQAPISLSRGRMPWNDYLQAFKKLEDSEVHFKLKNALIDNLWEKNGKSEVAAPT